MGIEIQIFLTLTLVGGEWSASSSGRFTPRERVQGTHEVGSWVDPRADLEDMETFKFFNLPGLELQPFSHPWRWEVHNKIVIKTEYNHELDDGQRGRATSINPWAVCL
jgi:hypothetical protein